MERLLDIVKYYDSYRVIRQGRLNNMKNTTFISMLNEVYQKQIREALVEKGLQEKDIENAMNSRLCDLEDTL